MRIAGGLRTKDAKVFFNDRADAVVMKDTGVLDIDSEEDYDGGDSRVPYQKDKLFGAINEKALELLSKRFWNTDGALSQEEILLLFQCGM